MTNSKATVTDLNGAEPEPGAEAADIDPAEAIRLAQDATDAELHLMPHQTFFLDENSQRWLVTARLGRVGDHIEVIGMDLRSFRLETEAHLSHLLPEQEDAVKLTAKTWRAAGALKDQLRVNYRRELGLAGLLEESDVDVKAAWTAPHHRKASRHEKIVELYERARADDKRPAVVIAEELQISETAASKRIQRARTAGYLPEAKAGRPRSSKIRAEPDSQVSD